MHMRVYAPVRHVYIRLPTCIPPLGLVFAFHGIFLSNPLRGRFPGRSTAGFRYLIFYGFRGLLIKILRPTSSCPCHVLLLPTLFLFSSLTALMWFQF